MRSTVLFVVLFACSDHPMVQDTSCTNCVLDPCAARQPWKLAVDGPRVGSPGETLMWRARTSAPDGAMVSYEWTFDDGTNASGVETSHAFTKSGAAKLAVTARDECKIAVHAGVDLLLCGGVQMACTGTAFGDTCCPGLVCVSSTCR